LCRHCLRMRWVKSWGPPFDLVCICRCFCGCVWFCRV